MTEDKIKHLTSNEDSQLFRESVGEVQRIQSDKRNLSADKPKVQKKNSNTPYQSTSHTTIKYEQLVKGDEVVFFSQPGVQNKTLRQLKRGEVNITGCLDLHGLTEINAQRAIVDFIQLHYEHSHRYIMIIHGKGIRSEGSFAILKNLTINLLNSHSDVLAYSSAITSDGGTGALYVLLRKN